MNLTPITFSDIQTSDLVYFDASIRDKCLQFCKDRDIDCLPSIIDPMKFYRKTETDFVEESVKPEMMVDVSDYIFKDKLLKKFRDNHLLFVYMNEELTGVVHFSDYNRPEINLFIFKLFSYYERSLRKLLVSLRYGNKDILDYFKHESETKKTKKEQEYYKDKIDGYNKHLSRNELLPCFERFDLKDLLEFAGHHKIMNLDQKIAVLRNDIMHAHELVNKRDANRDDYIYDFESFEKFFERVIALLNDNKRVNNRIGFSEIGR